MIIIQLNVIYSIYITLCAIKIINNEVINILKGIKNHIKSYVNKFG